MKRLVLIVEPIVGTTIRNIASDMIALAEQLDVMVEADVNGKRISAAPGNTPDDLVARMTRS